MGVEDEVDSFLQNKNKVKPVFYENRNTLVAEVLKLIEFSKKEMDFSIVAQELRKAGFQPDIKLIKDSIVENTEDTSNKMFEEFKKILEFFNADENTFKLSRLDKTHVYPMAVLQTASKTEDIIKQAKLTGEKPRYRFLAEFLKNYNIGCTALDSKLGNNKADQFKEIASSFVNFKSLLEYQQAKGIQGDEVGQPSEKLKRGILGR